MLLWTRNQAAQSAQQEVQGTSKATKGLCAQWNQLLLEDDMLYSQWQTKDGSGTQLELVLPRSLVPDILAAFYDAPKAGHLDVTKPLSECENDSTGMAWNVMAQISVGNVRSVRGGSTPWLQLEHY